MNMEKNFPSYIYDHVFRPVVLTVATPEAEALMKKHDGLTVAKYLNMHSNINERGNNFIIIIIFHKHFMLI